jgi:hypothetical protein
MTGKGVAMLRWSKTVVTLTFVTCCASVGVNSAGGATNTPLTKYCTPLYHLTPVPTVLLTNTTETSTDGALGEAGQIISGLTNARRYAPTKAIVSTINRAIIELQDEEGPLYGLNLLLSQYQAQGISHPTFAAKWRVGAIKANSFAVAAKPLVAAIGEGGAMCALIDDTYTAITRVQTEVLYQAGVDSFSNVGGGSTIIVANVVRAVVQFGAIFPVRLISTIPQSGPISFSRFALTVGGRVVDICTTFMNRPAMQIPYNSSGC